MNRMIVSAAAFLALAVAACDGFEDALTGHATPAVEAAGYWLSPEDLGLMMGASQIPDSMLTPYWAGEIARLWADYVVLVRVYQEPDSTRSLDYTRLLQEGRHLGALGVMRYRDSVVMEGVVPTEEELRRYWDREQPYTRLDVRRVVLTIDEDASDATRDSLYAAAREIRDRLAGGADFVQVARESSDEPVQARGQVIGYQGHSDFHAAADSIVFRLAPGAISPVIVAGDEILIYQIETRREPEYEAARDQLREQLAAQREEAREEAVLESLVDDSRRALMQGAVGLAREVASDSYMARDRVAGGLRLVTWDGGDFVVDELRGLFVVRGDIRDLFAEATDEELEDYLFQLARDEILMTEAERSGMMATEEEAEALSEAMADQLGHIAARLRISTQAVADPLFDVGQQSVWFVQGVLERSQPVPWLGEFRVVLDPQFPVRVDDGGVEIAARHARDLRRAGLGRAEDAEEATEEHESRVETG